MNKYKVPRLSNPQLNALLRGMEQKLTRGTLGCVWTNWRGMEVLRYYGWIEDEKTPKVIH